MIDVERLGATATEYGLHLSGHQLELLDCYATLLVEWNKNINLTAITLPKEIETKHFLDSLLLAAQPQVRGSVVDVGTGAGFPGVVAKIYKPDIQLTLMEPTGKRLLFLEAVCKALGIEAYLVKERAEEAARKRWRAAFDVATARAVAPLPALAEYCLPLVKQGGVFIAMKGEAKQELADAQGSIRKLGGAPAGQRRFTLPDGALRTLVFVDKVADTPKAYPRNGASIRKKPL